MSGLRTTVLLASLTTLLLAVVVNYGGVPIQGIRGGCYGAAICGKPFFSNYGNYSAHTLTYLCFTTLAS